ncbi:MAG: ABC transporter ATP-binding protein [Acidobacteriota bacterium]
MLEVSAVSKTYAGGIQALKDVTLTIPAGMFGLVGPNGAGKSTLMRSIATLQEINSGTISFNGLDVMKNRMAVREQLGYLPQDFGLYPTVSAWTLLNYFAALKGITGRSERHRTVEGLLKRTNLWDVRKRKLKTYSGGMRQRFGIAQALLGDPKLIIVDEPTAGLDPEERNRFLNLLSEIGGQVVVILSTHIVVDVSDLCSNMAIIANGEVRMTGSPREELRKLDGRIWVKSVERHELDVYGQRFSILSTHLREGRPHIRIFAGQRPDESFEPAAPELDDVYFRYLRN